MKVIIDEVRKLYEKVDSVWPENDKWHQYSRNQILYYIKRMHYNESSYLLNAGSGGSDYGLSNKMMHVDIAVNKIEQYPEYTVSSIDLMPFKDHTFTDVICVGSVINYCDALAAIHELSRVLKPRGSLLIEFESSWGYEHRKSKSFKQDADVVNLPYFGAMHTQWIYSPKYITRILEAAGLCITDKYCFHYLSGISFSNHQDENRAVRYTKFDGFCRWFPFTRSHANNVILRCSKL